VSGFCLESMARTVRMRARIVEMLMDLGPMTTTDIFNQLNKHRGSFALKHGATSNQLSNVLGKNATFRKITNQNDVTVGLDGYAYPICVWDIDRDYLESGIYIRGITDKLNQPKPTP